ncbi:Fic family protein [Vibrio vulnificus]|nr:Fic family protein [Vibrio vulnificus]MCU8168437.1 Fic family protein [Vibrio vulnificus]MCU8173002.1 Fic family protein [Vibrio vulnificus]
MNIFESVKNIELFEPKGASIDYLEEVITSITEIDSQRPLSPHIVEKIQEEILYDRVHSSAVIEGNKLSRRETIAVLSSGVIEAGSRKDQQEVRNLADCIIYIQECLDAKEILSKQIILELHQKLLSNLDNDNAGRFRTKDVAISGAKVIPPSHIDVPLLVDSILEVLNSTTVSGIQKSAYIHWAMARVHPFKDGNGRMARLIQDYILLQENLVPATIQPEDREKNYYEALEEADLGNGSAFLELIAKNILRTSQKYLSIIRDEKSKSDWIKNIAKAASENVRQTEHRKFLMTQRSLDAIKLEFSTVIKELNLQLENMNINYRDYGSLDFDKYQSLKNKGRAQRTWFFGVEFLYGDIRQRFIFWYGVHHKRLSDIQVLDGEISLLVSMEDDVGNYRKLDETAEERISIREIIPCDRTYLRRRFNPISQSDEWDENISVVNIVQEFIQEVLSKVGLI